MTVRARAARALLLTAALPVAVAAPVTPVRLSPPPLVQPARPGAVLPGQVQPLAPHTHVARPLPQVLLTPRVPQVRKVEYDSNGFIEAAHAVVLVGPTERAHLRTLAALVARRTLDARPSLAEVDVSVYDRAAYGGFGGPLPLFTASVPRERLDDFVRYAGNAGAYERAWTNPGREPTRAPLEAPERTLSFLGGSSELLRQQVQQAVSQFMGGVHGGLFFKGDSRSQLAALTFDDAPHPLYAPLVLDTLRRAGVHATFFCIGRNAEAYPYFVRDMVAQGHEVANHTYHHVRLPELSAAQVREELSQANAVLQGITGRPVRYFRPPGGEYSAQTLRVAEALGLVTTFWTDDPADFTNPGDAVLQERLLKHLRAGGIVLLHDNAPQALRVLPAFLELARGRQLTLVTVGRLARP
ncbi:polysaccharide deacetylase family protein [Deinococcus maricopensis]|uniref:Polysaccharide deacetylase n=1 Tax=Deinococcus maricopensis (strain DSM 21211 / LMG 22137 / NRRL B-23946 / LB-34) TaxID=709986 RepID=E8U6N4_DEIML|nr:polysaccharide deacetylase family protein [Deinococcus maricopensis]ADV66723.1 polysaccharide deacetylase [Deinococcus maricopensis DSM 21211]